MALALDVLSWLCLTTGAIFCVIGAIGTLRLPDVYTRTHAASITDTLGAGLVLLGLCFQGGLTLVTVKLVMIYAFMLYTGPAAGHALVKAAYAQGIKAWAVDRIDSRTGSQLPPRSESDSEDEGATKPEEAR